MVKRLIEHGHSFRYAFSGLMWVLKTERNFQLQVFIGICVFIAALVYQVDSVGLSFLVFSTFLVLVCEMINTAIEEVVDLATSEWRQKAKIAKDVSAGMVLLASFSSVCVGLLVLAPKILVSLY